MLIKSSEFIVSVLTSCAIDETRNVTDSLYAHGEHSYDLYIFQERDRALLAPASSLSVEDCESDNVSLAEFMCSLDVHKAADIIMTWLHPSLRNYCQPPFSPIRALATNFPDISDADPIRRETAREAVLQAARLAAELGASCVEIVGGYSFDLRERSEPGADGQTKPLHIRHDRAIGRVLTERRMDHLIESLKELNRSLDYEGIEVGLALECEPGAAYLLNDLHRVTGLLDDLPLKEYPHIGLNVDIGHMFILANESGAAIGPLVDPHSRLSEELYANRIMHFHASDHTRSHFCDLEIPSVHTREDFTRWIKLFLDAVSGQPSQYFTSTIAVEMEAARSIDNTVRSARTIREWTDELARIRNLLARPYKALSRMQNKSCCVVFCDIISSTELLMALSPTRVPEVLSEFIRQVETKVVSHRGFFDKFTGDGFMAIFEQDENEAASDVVQRSLLFANEVRPVGFSVFAGEHDEVAFGGLRVGVSYAPIYFGLMNDGPRAQITAVGEGVVLASRIMNECEPNEILVSEGVYGNALNKAVIHFHKTCDLKGLGQRNIFKFTGAAASKTVSTKRNPRSKREAE
jgi:class 3 adenylate cyclase/sugar phosphate isomerase/epimerase